MKSSTVYDKFFCFHFIPPTVFGSIPHLIYPPVPSGTTHFQYQLVFEVLPLLLSLFVYVDLLSRKTGSSRFCSQIFTFSWTTHTHVLYRFTTHTDLNSTTSPSLILYFRSPSSHVHPVSLSLENPVKFLQTKNRPPWSEQRLKTSLFTVFKFDWETST